MAGWWLTSYVLLWILVVTLSALTLGMLRQIGMLRLRTLRETEVVPVAQDGPPLGSHVPPLGPGLAAAPAPNGASPRGGHRTLLVFLNPSCGSCQQLVKPLNVLAESHEGGINPMVVVQGDRGDCSDFLDAFELRTPTVYDAERTITGELGVRRSPFGLLYDQEGLLVRKAALGGEDYLRALLGDADAAARVGAAVYPALRTTGIGTEAVTAALAK